MGDHKKDFCKKGHPFTEENTIIKEEGWKECRICKYARQIRSKRRERRNFWALMASLKLSVIYGDLLVGTDKISEIKTNARIFAEASKQVAGRSSEIRRARQKEEILDAAVIGTESVQKDRKYGASN